MIKTANSLPIVTRRRVSLDRPLALWKRESLTTSSTKKLIIHYSGEKGIDDGAIHMEFLTDVISEIKSIVFPTGNPRDSMLDVHNNNPFKRGQIAAVSLANGRTVPNLLHDNIFYLMFTKITLIY